jgi:hypothetical protein
MTVFLIWVTFPSQHFLQIPKKVGLNYSYNPFFISLSVY